MYEEIDTYIGKCTRLDREGLELFHSKLQYREVRKKTFLLQAGDVCNFEAYIRKGCIRAYYLDEKGNQVTLHFAVEDWWVSDIASFNERTPSSLFLETLEDSELFLLQYADKEELYQQLPQLERMFRIMIQRAYSVLQDRLYATVAKPAEDRYLEFLDRYPDIPLRVPQHMIASYLGISPEFLSKIRTKLAKG